MQLMVVDCITTDQMEELFLDVWESKAVITDKGWVVEMRIPYAPGFRQKTNKLGD
jgi:hypothetical protein